MKTEHINKLNEYKKVYEELIENTKKEFQENLQNLFVENPTLKSFKVRINNHEFNDGDPTTFSLYYEELEVKDNDGNEYVTDFYPSSRNSKEVNPLAQAVYDLLSTYDVGDLYERIFGNEYDSLEISRQNVNKY